MFSNRIANSAKFLQMPEGAQLLYFHMVQRADDDGVVEAYPLLKLLGSAPDNFKVLLAKGFICQLNDDQVTVITDWLEHNTIRADRKVDSIYKSLLVEQVPKMKLIQPKPRSDVGDNSRRICVDSPRTAEDRLGKDRLGKDNNTTAHSAAGVSDLIKLFQHVNPSYRLLFARPPQRAAGGRLLQLHAIDWWTRFMPAYMEAMNDRYCPKATTPVQMEEKIAAIELYGRSKKNEKQAKANNIAFL